MHYLFFETTVDWQLPINLCLLISGLWMLDKGSLPRAITAENYLNVLGARELSSDKMSQVNRVSFCLKRVKSCLTWVNFVFQSLPPPPCLWI